MNTLHDKMLDGSQVINVRVLSNLLLTLYDAARTPTVDTFQDEVLTEISKIIPFDASSWGIGTIDRENSYIKGAHMRNFDEDVVSFLNVNNANNIVAKAIREHSGVVHIFSSQDLSYDSESANIWNHLGGITQVLCYGSADRKAGLVSFFIIARRHDDRPFTQEDALWIELLAPHLEATLQICRVSELQHAKSRSNSSHTRRAISDVCGVLHVAEPGFAELLHEEWPEWRGPTLPKQLLKISPSTDSQELVLKKITVSITGVAHQLLITASRRSQVDLLTSQQRIVAEAFAQGLSYKEVAQLLNRSPTTIRSHLSAAYSKLGVRDKAALARALFTMSDIKD